MKRLNVDTIYGIIKLSFYEAASESTVSEEVSPLIRSSCRILVDLDHIDLDTRSLGSFSNILKIYQKRWGKEEKLALVNVSLKTESLFRKGKIADSVIFLEDYGDFFLSSS